MKRKGDEIAKEAVEKKQKFTPRLLLAEGGPQTNFWEFHASGKEEELESFLTQLNKELVQRCEAYTVIPYPPDEENIWVAVGSFVTQEKWEPIIPRPKSGQMSKKVDHWKPDIRWVKKGVSIATDNWIPEQVVLITPSCSRDHYREEKIDTDCVQKYSWDIVGTWAGNLAIAKQESKEKTRVLKKMLLQKGVPEKEVQRALNKTNGKSVVWGRAYGDTEALNTQIAKKLAKRKESLTETPQSWGGEQ